MILFLDFDGVMHNVKSIVALVLLCACTAVAAATFSGQVVGVADGDTVTVLDDEKIQHKIRLSGIDAPEKKQAFGMRSKQSLSDLVFDKLVNVETEKRDKYGREVGKILIGSRDINLEQVTRGFAWHYKAYEQEQPANDRKLYDFAEQSARAGRRGLWADAEPVPPWEFRHRKR